MQCTSRMQTQSWPSAELLTFIQPWWTYLAHEASCTGDQHILSGIVFWDAHHDDSPPILIWTKAFKSSPENKTRISLTSASLFQWCEHHPPNSKKVFRKDQTTPKSIDRINKFRINWHLYSKNNYLQRELQTVARGKLEAYQYWSMQKSFTGLLISDIEV